jgi:hypothetical protein
VDPGPAAPEPAAQLESAEAPAAVALEVERAPEASVVRLALGIRAPTLAFRVSINRRICRDLLRSVSLASFCLPGS